MKNYYHILGIAPDSPQADIKRAYRQLAVQHHPDKNNGNSKSEERFKEISEAYIILSDEQARNEYDYAKGFKNSYRGNKNTSGKPSPVQYLIRIKTIKDRVLHNGGRVSKQALFTTIDNLLSDENINYLISERDLATNSLIIDEVFTCCIFLDENFKTPLCEKLKKLSGNSAYFREKMAVINRPHCFEIPKHSPTAQPETAVPFTTVLIFLLFLLLFIVLVIVLK